MTQKLDKIKSNIIKSVELISRSKKIVLMTGAGISVDSGIPTFQGTEGLWARFGKPKMNAFSEFIKNDDSWWDREINHQRSPYVMELRRAIERAKPNDAHYAICNIQRLGKIDHVITQNIDGLHVESGCNNVIEVHGNRNYLRCVDCEKRYQFSSPISEKPLPCSNCGGVIKYDSVMFGEPIPKSILKNSKDAIRDCDLLIIIGSSSTVRPAAGFSWIAKSEGAKLIEININDTKLSSECEIILRGSSSEILPSLYQGIASL
ncbi:MAG: Sir2 family NAD-dependent protein deacetylase [Chloroflexota bacterium]|mgnify:CR=1 FL=1|nr:Sir2 family NAD-dependent protein deacetylase [Chloroflexota bacterium]